MQNIKIYLIPFLVFTSGFCSLVYQVAWERIIKFGLGGDQISSFVVTSSFLLGLGIGAFLFKNSFKNPLKAYAVIEFLISLFAFSSYFIFTELITFANQSILSENSIEYLRLNTTFLSFVLLIPPCILIGGTMPIFFDCFFNTTNYSSKKLGLIYGLNTLGACIGIASIPLIFFNNISIPSTLFIVGTINLFISIILFVLTYQNNHSKYLVNQPSDQNNMPIYKNSFESFKKINLLYISFLSGGIAFLMEIVFFRMASTNWPSSAYNFPMVLMLFLFFMSMGSIYFSSLTKDSISRSKDILLNLFLCSLLCVVSTIFIQVFFITNSIISILIKYTLLIGPFAFFQGGIFPIILNIATTQSRDLSRSTGVIYLINSLGAFLTVAIAQFILFKAVGLKGVIYFIIILCSISMIVIYYDHQNTRALKNRILVPLITIFALTFINDKTWNMYTYLQNTENITASQGATGIATITWHEKELLNGIKGEIRINSHYMSALPNHPGHIEFEIFGLSALKKEKFLVLGLGGGGMLRELNEDSSINKINVVDWSNEIKYVLQDPKAMDLLDGVLISDKVNLFQGDARQYVNLENKLSNDVIIDNLAYTYMSGATSVKSLEYFQEISRILDKKGLFILSINGRDSRHADAVISSVVKSFKSVYSLNNLLIASNYSLDCLFKKSNQKIVDYKCPINKSKFFEVFNNHDQELPAIYESLDPLSYLEKFKKHSNQDFYEIPPIRDNLPIYEYYLCFNTKNSKCR